MGIDLFDANFYRAANPDLATAGLTTDTQLLSHFQNSGIDEGRLFSPFANINFYRSSNPDLAAAGLNTNRQALEHLQNNGVAEGRRFSPLVDINFYLTANPDVNQAFGGSRERALEHLRDSGVAEGRIFSPFIGVEDSTSVDLTVEASGLNYYLAVNPDVNQAFGGNRNLALQHLELSGVAEGRSFSPFVDLSYYLSNNSDLNQAFKGNRVQGLEHLVNFGLTEGRRFSPAFDVNSYRNRYPDLREAGLTNNEQLFQHWVIDGALIDERSGTSDPGNSFGTALDLGSPALSITGFNDFVSGSDSRDYYRFTLNESRTLGVQLTGQSIDADLELLNANRTVLLESSASGSNAEAVSYISLNPGTYYLRISALTSNPSNYNLFVSILPSQVPGNTLNTASASSTRGGTTIESIGNINLNSLLNSVQESHSSTR